jgi:hypothetical protein
MTPRSLSRFDAAAAALLLLWAGMLAGFAILMAPLLFSILPSRDLAGLIASRVVARLDVAAFIAFAGAMALTLFPRWLEGIGDGDALGPQRLWTAAALVALLTCFASVFIISPKLRAIRAGLNAPIETVAADSPVRAAYQKAHATSRQFMALRLLLALGLAAGIAALPRAGKAAA